MRHRLPTGSLLPIGAALSVIAAAAWVVLPTVQDQAPVAPDVRLHDVELTAPGVPLANDWETSAATGAELVAVQWQGDPSAAFTVEAQDSTGAWTEAFELEDMQTEGHEADPGTEEARLAAEADPAQHASEPAWLGPDVVNVRVTLADGTPSDVELTEISSPPVSAPPGSAAAAGGPFGAFDGIPRSMATITFIVGVALLAAALLSGRSRWRRAAATAAVLALVAGVSVIPSSSAEAAAKPPIIKRAQWGADESRRTCGPDYNRRIQIAVIHHTAGSNNYSPQESASIVNGIYAFHTGSGEYCDIAYNFLVDKYGQVFEGRFGGIGKIVQAAHALNFNQRSLGIAVLGSYDPPSGGKNFVENEVIWRYQDLVAWKFEKHAVGDPRATIKYKDATGTRHMMKRVVSHRSTYATACPGVPIRKRMGEIRDGAAFKMGL